MWTASKLSRHCAHHHVLSELHPRPTRYAAAKKGTVFHAALAEWQQTGVIPALADDDVMAWLQVMVDHDWGWPDGVELEKAWGLSPWGTFVPVEETAPGSHEYKSIDGEDLLTAGRSDAVWMAGDVLVSADWKTGRSMAPAAVVNLQVNAAGIAHAQRWKARAYQPAVYYARSGTWDVAMAIDVGSPQWDEMLERVKEAAALDDQPHPGPHCSDCFERKVWNASQR